MKLKDNQKTYLPTEKDVESKKWFVVDVKGKTLGPTATKIANLLRGKGKPIFSPQVDCGDYVVVLNAKEIRLSGGKMETKEYFWHTQYPGGIRSRKAKDLIKEKPTKILYDAVWGMLPRNKLRSKLIRKLRIFPGEVHTHESQKLQEVKL